MFHVEVGMTGGRIRVPGSLKGAAWYAAFVVFVSRLGWLFREVPSDDRLESLSFVWYVLPALLLLFSLFGNSVWRDGRRRVEQHWASLFLGLAAIGVYVVTVFIPGWWALVLFVPAVALFRPFYRVKLDEPGALERFHDSERIENAKEPFRALVDALEGTGWRARFEASVRADERREKERRHWAWVRSHPKAVARRRAKAGLPPLPPEAVAEAEARSYRIERGHGTDGHDGSDGGDERLPDVVTYPIAAVIVVGIELYRFVVVRCQTLWARHGGVLRRVPLALRVSLAFSTFVAGLAAMRLLMSHGHRALSEGAAMLLMLGFPPLVGAASFLGPRLPPGQGGSRKRLWASLVLAPLAITVYTGQLYLPGYWIAPSVLGAALVFWPFWRVKLAKPASAAGTTDVVEASSRPGAEGEERRALQAAAGSTNGLSAS